MFELKLEDIFTQSSYEIALKKLKKSSLGFDNLAIDEICTVNFYEKLKDEILNLSYSPQPLRRVLIPKTDKNDFRKLAIPSLKDKLIQNILILELSNYFDKGFLNFSYAYRSGKSYVNAIYRLRDFLKIYPYIIKSDIKDFFENIDHEILMGILNNHIKDNRIIRLIELWVKNGIFSKFEYLYHRNGIHQGDVLSPLLSNIYLHQMDMFLYARGIDFVRYADDFVILSRREEEAKKILIDLKVFLSTIKLSLNEDKTVIRDRTSEFMFLGINFKGEVLTIRDEKLSSIIKNISSKSKKKTIKESVDSLNSYIFHLKSINLKLLSENQRNRFMENFDEIITDLIRRFIKSTSKKILVGELVNLEFPFPLTNKLRKIKLLSYYKNAKKPRIKSVKKVLEDKKREYLKKFSNSSLIHITTPFYFLAISRGKFVLKEHGKIKYKFPINQISQIIINADTSMSSSVIKECSKKKISIDFIDERTNLSYATLFTSNISITKAAVSQLSILKTKKSLRIAQQFVIGKVKNQINYLKYLNKYHRILDREIEAIQGILSNFIPASTSTMELMGYEGASANWYWQAIAKTIDYKFGFSARITKGATDMVNAALNYAYAILYSKVLRSIVSAGLSPHISYLHALDDQKPTLAFDLIEEFRAFIVDRAIVSMINKNEPFDIKDGFLSIETRKNIAKNINEKLFSYTKFRSEKIKTQDIITKQAYALRRSILEDIKYKPFIARFQ